MMRKPPATPRWRGRCVAALLAFVATLGGPAPASGQWVVGLQGGLPSYSVAGDAPEGAGYTRQTRAMAAAILGYRLSSAVVLRLEPGLLFKGAGVAYDVDGIEDPVDSLSLELDYLSLPVVAQVFTPGGRGFATLGFEVGFLSSATITTEGGSVTQDVEPLLRSTDVSMMFGAGGLVRRSRPEVSLELRFSQSLAKVLREDDTGQVALPQGFRSSGLQLTAGVSWGLGGDR